MAQVVIEIPLTLAETVAEFRLPAHSSPLAVLAKAGTPTVCVLMDAGAPNANATYRFQLVRSGETVPEGEWTHHLESLVLDGRTVVHVFETVTFDSDQAREQYLSPDRDSAGE